jgi:hypothetical protein
MILQRNELDVRVVSQILEDINAEIEASDEEEKAPQVKKQFVILVSDPAERPIDTNVGEGEFIGSGWVLQVEEDSDPLNAVERLVKAAYEFNITPKGRRMPVKTIAEVCEHVSARVTKEQNVWIKTKEPVYVLRTGGKVPLDEIKKLRRKNENQADDRTVYDDGVHAIRVADDEASDRKA